MLDEKHPVGLDKFFFELIWRHKEVEYPVLEVLSRVVRANGQYEEDGQFVAWVLRVALAVPLDRVVQADRVPWRHRSVGRGWYHRGAGNTRETNPPRGQCRAAHSGEASLDEPGVDGAGHKIRMGNHPTQKRQGRLDGLDDELGKTPLHALDRLGPGRLVDDDLGQE